jgi:precorrin-6B methylase 2
MLIENSEPSKLRSTNRIPHVASSIVIKDIPRWHFAMLNDRQRNQAFFDAIEATDFTDKTVLDIGTGSGLLAMLIARKGARHVYTCECNPLVAAKAKKIIDINGLTDNITVINKLSTDLIPGIDLPTGIDAMISETVDCGFFGEGFAHSLKHAQSQLIKPDADIIPSAVSLHACILSSQDVANLNSVSNDIFGLDVSAFNVFKTTGYFPVRLQTWPHQLVSNIVAFQSVVLNPGFSFDKEEFLTLTARADALAHGIVFWFDLYLKDGIHLSNNPHNTHSHWMQAVQLFDYPAYVCKGYSYELKVSISSDGVRFGEKLEQPVQQNIAS